ncbi:Ubiquinol-cytochrome C chaperone [Teladorsagia circumcincta]|uniref:Ubiquinol-cytochrome C chaperone n=1 Tax=Teladorsagia circumcincta TaxID=45464 RepID=A0A2G9UL24_TELCI|nr:Ubiquinol-cytochrome C chaperone [Teladorsagia circumcincta]
MLARSTVRRLVHVRSIASTSRDPPVANKVVPVDEYTQNLLSSPPSRLPKTILRLKAAFKNKFTKETVDPLLKDLLDTASAQLYYNCANNYDYQKLMVLLRMHSSLDAQAYLRLQRSMLATMWFDVDARLKIVSEEIKQSLTSQSDLKSMHGLHLQTFLEYDEGFLANDRLLAAALWRCLYMGRSCDPIHVLRAIAYIRSTMAWLDTLDLKDIMVDGIKEWKQVKLKDIAQESKVESEIAESEDSRKVGSQIA